MRDRGRLLREPLLVYYRGRSANALEARRSHFPRTPERRRQVSRTGCRYPRRCPGETRHSPKAGDIPHRSDPWMHAVETPSHMLRNAPFRSSKLITRVRFPPPASSALLSRLPVSYLRLGVPESKRLRVGEEVDDLAVLDPPLALLPELRLEQVGVVAHE
jgi:hypothetical protein